MSWLFFYLDTMVQFDELIWVPKRMCPTGPGGRGWGCRGDHLPNQILTSMETAEFLAEALERGDKKEQIKEKDHFCKKALAQNTKMERMAKRGTGGQWDRRRGRGTKK